MTTVSDGLSPVSSGLERLLRPLLSKKAMRDDREIRCSRWEALLA